MTNVNITSKIVQRFTPEIFNSCTKEQKFLIKEKRNLCNYRMCDSVSELRPRVLKVTLKFEILVLPIILFLYFLVLSSKVWILTEVSSFSYFPNTTSFQVFIMCILVVILFLTISVLNMQYFFYVLQLFVILWKRGLIQTVILHTHYRKQRIKYKGGKKSKQKQCHKIFLLTKSLGIEIGI